MKSEESELDTLANTIGKLVLMLAAVLFVGWIMSIFNSEEEIEDAPIS